VKTEVKRKFLEIKSIEDLLVAIQPNKLCTLNLVEPPDFQINKFFYKQIGKNCRWIDRLSWSDQKWIDYLNNKNVKTYILRDKEELVGYFEQIFSNEDKSCEIAYLGILEEYFEKKYGGYLLTEAIKKSFLNSTKKVWVHTCSLDHKNALKNYLARGMKVFKSETIFLNLD
tara:strand:+ start:345 stop:857 length:513 start_codon:yes stop_codon:yes gene_type:complete